jgi:hypothetical protein
MSDGIFNKTPEPTKKTSGPGGSKQALGFGLGGAIGLVAGIGIGLLIKGELSESSRFVQMMAMTAPAGVGFFVGAVLGAVLTKPKK